MPLVKMLAVSDAMGFWVPTVVSVMAIVVEVVLFISLRRMDQRIHLWERREDKYGADMKEVEDRLHTTNVKLIDERFRGMTHEMMNHAQALSSAMDEVKSRIKEGDGDFRSLGERDHKIELQMLANISEVKTLVIERAASKEDLREHQKSMENSVGKLDERLRRIEQKVS